MLSGYKLCLPDKQCNALCQPGAGIRQIRYNGTRCSHVTNFGEALHLNYHDLPKLDE